jgi:hypothetical protein
MIRRFLFVLLIPMFAGLTAHSVRADVMAERFVKFRLVGTSNTVEQNEKVAYQGMKKRSDPITDYKSGTTLLWGSAKQWNVTRLDKDIVWQMHEAKKAYTEAPLSSLKPRDEQKKEEKHKPDSKLISAEAKGERTNETKTINGFATRRSTVSWAIEVERIESKKHVKCRLTADFWNTEGDARFQAYARESAAFEQALRQKLGEPPIDPQEAWLGFEAAASGACAGDTDKPLERGPLREALKKVQGDIVLFQARWETDDPDAQGAEDVSAKSLAKEALGGVMSIFGDDDEKEKKPAKKGGLAVIYEADVEVKKIDTAAVDGKLFDLPAGFKQVKEL